MVVLRGHRLLQRRDTSAQSQSAPGFIRSITDRFEHANPFVRGERNGIALKLGREAARNGLSRTELDEMCKIFAERHHSDDFTRRDILSRACAGYQYFMQNGGSNKSENRGQFGARATYGPPSGDVSKILPTEEEEINDEIPADDSPEEIRHHNNETRKKSPLIPAEVHQNLPEFLKRCVALASDERQKGLVLLGSLYCRSVTLPDVRFRYNKNAPMAMKKPHKLDVILAQLTAKFTYTKYISTASNLDIPKTTVIQILRRAKTSQIIEKEGNTYRKGNRDKNK